MTQTKSIQNFSEDYADAILCSALDIGQLLLKSGAEIFRVEDTIERICFAYGAAHVESFSITTLIVASVRMKDGEFSEQMRHVKTSAMNLYRVEMLNNISREICQDGISIAEAREKIKNGDLGEIICNGEISFDITNTFIEGTEVSVETTSDTE